MCIKKKGNVDFDRERIREGIVTNLGIGRKGGHSKTSCCRTDKGQLQQYNRSRSSVEKSAKYQVKWGAFVATLCASRRYQSD